jgi:ABC-2 type transport system permease protein
MAQPLPREIGRVNWVGMGTHLAKEIRRFLKVGLQTLLAPVVTTLLFLAVFSLALGRALEQVGGVPFAEFLAPGLIMMAVIQNSFANTATSLMSAKIQGNIVDVLMPPLNSAELTFGFAVGGAVRGILVAGCVALGMWLFVPVRIHSFGFVAFHAVAASMLLSMAGLITGILCEKFDHQASVSNFLIMPLSFLSGSFYSIERLPPFWQEVALYNPFFYMIDGFRYGFIGHADASLLAGIVVIGALNVALWVICHYMLATGYRLKS